MVVNSLPKIVTRHRSGCDLSPGRSAPESTRSPLGYRATLVQYDTRNYFNVRSKADISYFNLLYGTILEVEKRKN